MYSEYLCGLKPYAGFFCDEKWGSHGGGQIHFNTRARKNFASRNLNQSGVFCVFKCIRALQILLYTRDIRIHKDRCLSWGVFGRIHLNTLNTLGNFTIGKFYPVIFPILAMIGVGSERECIKVYSEAGQRTSDASMTTEGRNEPFLGLGGRAFRSFLASLSA